MTAEQAEGARLKLEQANALLLQAFEHLGGWGSGPESDMVVARIQDARSSTGRALRRLPRPA